ncbi:Rv1355c family protein [Algoriphagus kandeliae]|uniref:Rv1355c family protein n=1 Tax=Algoriphagus kandeliae TaxID=2562278 RepID=A0A4Y9R0Y1_9BACT|nr:Rv1355c family protein [Algoriphagus kandeliae]TFV97103.1 Rv1355c family protein [Algoriphagus kandeliae]
MLASPKIDLESLAFPILLDPKLPQHMEEILRLKELPYVVIVDQIESQVKDLIKAASPSVSYSSEELTNKAKDFFQKEESETYGIWVFYPWKNHLVHILPKEDFIRIRTIRNNYKITPQEHEYLAGKKIGIVGLSVGQSIALAMALERSCGEMRLADFDTLELSNLNRLKAGVTSLGLEKVVIAAREISEIDPYLNLTLYRKGVTEQNIDDFFTANGKLDLVIDECDSLDMKILLREKAKFYGIPVLMDTSDRGMLDVERFDLEPDRPIFHGLMGNIDLSSLKNLTTQQKVGIGLKITGTDTLSPRMKASLLEVGQTISSWPQLASAVFLGGASVAHVGRRLLLGDQVKSGRYYVDLDEIVHLEALEEIKVPDLKNVQNGDFKAAIPDDILPSGYLPSEKELEEMISFANLAPSGGNIQPWIWVLDQRGILHLFHDKVRSFSLLDYKGTGSLIAFGAALENLRIFCGKHGIEIEVIPQIREFDDDLIASVRFVSKQNQSLNIPHLDLFDGVGIRCTNRKNPKRKPLNEDQLDSILSLVDSKEMSLDFLTDEKDLEKLSEILGGMDRMRLFHEQGLQDFIQEVRWNDKEARETKDGIDLATLELSGAERAAMGLLKDPRTVKFFRKFLMGYGLTKISHSTLMASSAIFLLQSKKYTPESILEAGKILQRIWIKANMMGIAFQPVTASLFIFQRVKREKDHGFEEPETQLIAEHYQALKKLYGVKDGMEEIFMFRLNFAGEPSMRSYRRDVSETLIRI